MDNGTVFFLTRKYPLRGYILGVLKHTTALDRLWGGDKTLKCGIHLVLRYGIKIDLPLTIEGLVKVILIEAKILREGGGEYYNRNFLKGGG